MAIDFNAILSKQAATIEKPKPLPVGMYLCNNPQLPKFEGIGKKETPGANFGLVVLQPGDDVDQDQLREYGQYQGKNLRYTMWLTENSEYRTKEELCKAFGLEEGDKTLGQLFNETISKQVYAVVTHRPSEDGTEMYHEVSELKPV